MEQLGGVSYLYAPDHPAGAVVAKHVRGRWRACRSAAGNSTVQRAGRAPRRPAPASACAPSRPAAPGPPIRKTRFGSRARMRPASPSPPAGATASRAGCHPEPPGRLHTVVMRDQKYLNEADRTCALAGSTGGAALFAKSILLIAAFDPYCCRHNVLSFSFGFRLAVSLGASYRASGNSSLMADSSASNHASNLEWPRKWTSSAARRATGPLGGLRHRTDAGWLRYMDHCRDPPV